MENFACICLVILSLAMLALSSHQKVGYEVTIHHAPKAQHHHDGNKHKGHHRGVGHSHRYDYREFNGIHKEHGGDLGHDGAANDGQGYGGYSVISGGKQDDENRGYDGADAGKGYGGHDEGHGGHGEDHRSYSDDEGHESYSDDEGHESYSDDGREGHGSYSDDGRKGHGDGRK